MTRQLLTGNAAAAWGARLAGVDYVPAFPITPQTEIIETLSRWFERGEIPGRLTMMESEHSMVTAAGAAAATGVRVFTATSSQGLLYAMEMIFTVAGWRAPFVLVNVSRGLASPITLESDHNDVLAARDSGFLQVHCATCQEVLDHVLLAYRVAEDERVRLPVIVNLDGFTLSFTREPVELPSPDAVSKFLPPFDPQNVRFRASKPVSQAVAVLAGTPYSYFRYETHLAAQQALVVLDEVSAEFFQAFGRHTGPIATYRSGDADMVFVMIGANATKACDAVDRLREAGIAAGVVRPRWLRPYPAASLRAELKGKKAVAVIDQDLSMGQGGVLYAELAAALYGMANAPALASFVGGLGGRNIPPEEFYDIARRTLAAAERGEMLPPQLLFTEHELRQVRKLQAVAAVERKELGEKP